jgi:aminoglycoside phosphotransferase
VAPSPGIDPCDSWYSMTTTDAPDTGLAADLAEAAVGCRPIGIRRFDTGLHHYVFEAVFEDRAPVVVRIAAGHSRSAMAGALKLSRLLRPRGVPLPELIAEDLSGPSSHLVLERLPGTDLGEVIRGLSDSSLEGIAANIAGAQRITADTASAGRYGYGIDPKDAPYESWSQVLQYNLVRSRKRIATAKLFSQDAVNTVAKLVSDARAELDALPPVPFLHDTTTKNVVVTATGTFSGIVDVDDLCFGDPRYVIGLTLASLAVSGGPVHYIDAWMKSANYRDDRIFRLYVVLFLVDFMSEHGQTFNGNPRSSSTDDRNRLLHIFAERLQRLD